MLSITIPFDGQISNEVPFLQVFRPQFCMNFSSPSWVARCPTRPILTYLKTLLRKGESKKARSSPLCNFLYHFLLPLSQVLIFFSATFSPALSNCVSPSGRSVTCIQNKDKVSCLYKIPHEERPSFTPIKLSTNNFVKVQANFIRFQSQLQQA
jgi:hypothetical protein